MKKYFFILCLIDAAIAGPCKDASGSFRRNPDGSEGGFVSNTAVVSSEVFISADSEICGKVKITGQNQILAHSIISENVVVEGNSVVENSKIFGGARVSGKAFISKSIICQNSLIEGIKVLNSDYYCQTEDPAPQDPGNSGRLTLMGVDSDADGVRDDLEVFINDNLYNTPSKNRKEERYASKLYAKIIVKEMLHKKNKVEILRLTGLRQDLTRCFDLSLKDEIFVRSQDTKERLFSVIEAVGNLHGEIIEIPNKSCKSLSTLSLDVQ